MAYVEGTRNRSDGVIQSGPVYPGIEDARKKVGFFVGHNSGPRSRVFIQAAAAEASSHGHSNGQGFLDGHRVPCS